jgi:hypothetical protein
MASLPEEMRDTVAYLPMSSLFDGAPRVHVTRPMLNQLFTNGKAGSFTVQHLRDFDRQQRRFTDFPQLIDAVTAAEAVRVQKLEEDEKQRRADVAAWQQQQQQRRKADADAMNAKALEDERRAAEYESEMSKVREEAQKSADEEERRRLTQAEAMGGGWAGRRASHGRTMFNANGLPHSRQVGVITLASFNHHITHFTLYSFVSLPFLTR